MGRVDATAAWRFTGNLSGVTTADSRKTLSQTGGLSRTFFTILFFAIALRAGVSDSVGIARTGKTCGLDDKIKYCYGTNALTEFTPWWRGRVASTPLRDVRITGSRRARTLKPPSR